MTRFVSIGVAGVLALLFAGALGWARSRDPFVRVWFSVRTAAHGKARGVAVVPKPVRSRPVVVFVHGAGSHPGIVDDGMKLRQMAELGLAAVSLEYNMTNWAAFEAQFAALLAFVRGQPWADPHAIAWVGNSLGANRLLSFALRHPEQQPQLLVRIGGGAVEELASGLMGLRSAVLMLHGEHDEVFPLAEAERVAAVLRQDGTVVEVKVLPGLAHGLGADSDWVYRAVGEHCRTQLVGPTAWAQYHSIGRWRAEAWGLWVYWLPAFLWGAGWGLWRWRLRRAAGRATRPAPRTRSKVALRWVAGGVAALALGQTGIHLITPQLPVNDATLALARRFLVPPKQGVEFDVLASAPFWRGERLKTLLEHVELSHYCRTLVNWKIDDVVYREFVLSPIIEAERTKGLGWRRLLWESFYPRVRREQSAEVAAGIVARHLRAHVTVVPGQDWGADVSETWQNQIADPAEFERILVAALRSVCIPAKLRVGRPAEFWDGSAWRPVPLLAFTTPPTLNCHE